MWSQAYHFFDLSLGGGFRGIRNRALIGCMSHRATNKDREYERKREIDRDSERQKEPDGDRSSDRKQKIKSILSGTIHR